jgi:glucose/arabinose dehydrogenase
MFLVALSLSLGACSGERAEATSTSTAQTQTAIPPSTSILSKTLPAGGTPIFYAERGPYRVVTVVTELQDPWSIAFLPNDDMLVTEKPGRLRIVRNGTLQAAPIAGTPTVRYEGQGGLMEVALHPQFVSNQLVYLSYSKLSEDGSQSTTAVGRGRLEGDRLVDFKDIFVAKAWSSGANHYGSKLAFDRQGYLFITVGDRQVNPLSMPVERHPAQDLSTHNGRVIRLHDDGRVPSDNPFVGRAGALPEIWTYGHRNPQGLVVHPETGDVWVTEHGPQGGDELNLILPGRNYGWPVVGFGVQYGGTQFHLGTHRPGFEPPLQQWTPSIAPSGLIVYTGNRFPEWRGNLFTGGLDGRTIARVAITGSNGRYQVERLERPGLIPGFGRIREVREGPDGYIYVAIDDRRGRGFTPIVRLEPVDEDS